MVHAPVCAGNPNAPEQSAESRGDVDPHGGMPWEPFPLHALPPVVRPYVEASAAAIGCDPSMIALPVLAVCAGLIGVTWAITPKRSWKEFAILWAAVVAQSGSHKSPAFSAATDPLWDLQRETWKRHAEAKSKAAKQIAEQNEAALSGERDDEAVATDMVRLADPQSEGDDTESGNEQTNGEDEPPPPPQFVVNDTTVERLAEILQENPRGVTLAVDELSQWFGGFIRYKKSGGGDGNAWLSLHSGKTLLIQRKTSFPRDLFVHPAAVSICGTIQPAILRGAFTTENKESGLAARLLLAAPPRQQKRWSDCEVDDEIRDRYSRLLISLSEIKFSDEKKRLPHLARLQGAVRKQFVEYYDSWAEEQHGETDPGLCAAFAKIEAYSLRFTLIDHVIHTVLDPNRRFEGVHHDSLTRGIELANWFASETRRVYGMLAEDEKQSELRELEKWIRKCGGSVQTRDLQKRNGKRFTTTEAAKIHLNQLVVAGRAEWLQAPTRTPGRTTEILRLLPVRQSDISDNSTDAPNGPEGTRPTNRTPPSVKAGNSLSKTDLSELSDCRTGSPDGKASVGRPDPKSDLSDEAIDEDEAERELRLERDAIQACS